MKNYKPCDKLIKWKIIPCNVCIDGISIHCIKHGFVVNIQKCIYDMYDGKSLYLRYIGFLSAS